ncbi:amidohydrolase family protein [Nocardia blacklockiae]|uniref:amidohydrolase family protein n=1 Tax=Nocardia blacklockiae TaxID=480036 RepID=UPI0018962A0D|nr:amidohydrolase family protein [Nocardia blacklockiae]MBF6174957.1 amidohydrolase family protein [Nocardia blacklockiae]
MSRILLRGAKVVTMAPHRADAEDIDILIDGDRIAEIGSRLRADDVETVDLSGRIVIPGLVNAHLHTWQTALRFAGTDWTLPDYLAQAHGVAARHYRPDDMRIGTAAGAVSQINSGVTTIGDWCHNCGTPEHADAAVEGLRQAGVRAVFLHGTPHALVDRPHDTREIDRLIDGAIGASDLLSVGMAIKGPQLSKPDVALADLRAATERGVLASMHQSAGAPGAGWEAVRAAGLWSPLTNIVHGTGLTDDTVRQLVDAGATITSTPENELGQGHCTAVVDHLLRCGAAPSLGTDTEVVVAGDMLVAARLCLAQHRGAAHAHEYRRTGLGAPQMPLTAGHALSWATLEGARALGLADRIGTIEPGKQADLVILDARMLNLWPSHDPVAAALNSTTANVESVMIAGAWRKRDHVLLAGPVDELMDELRNSGERILREIRGTGLFARVQRRVVRQVVRRQLRRQAQQRGRPQP